MPNVRQLQEDSNILNKMADEKEIPTLKEIQEMTKKEIASHVANLESKFFLDILGVNELTNARGPYGAFGLDAGEGQYSGVFGSSDANKVRKEVYDGEMERRAKMGISERPSYPDNYQVAKYVIGAMSQSVSALPLSDLEKALQGINKGINLNIPEQLKKYEEAKTRTIQKALAEGKKPEEIKLKLDDVSEKIIKNRKNTAYRMLKRAAALRLENQHGYDEFNAEIERDNQAYRQAKGIPDPEQRAA